MATTDDVVQIQIGDEFPVRVQEYNVKLSVFEQPGTFSATIGDRGSFKSLAKRFPCKSPYAVYINGRRVQVGYTDQFSKNGGASIVVTGRGIISRLIDSEVSSEKTFKETTYLDLTKQALAEVGLGDVKVSSSNFANRLAVTGSKNDRTFRQAAERNETTIAEEGGKKIVRNTLRAKVDSKWWDFLVEQYRREGLFLWEDTNGDMVLSTPDIDQAPRYRFYRMIGEGRSNILDDDEYSIDVSDRHTECRVYGRTASGKKGVGKFFSAFIDDEMVALLNAPGSRADGGKIKQLKTIRDAAVRSDAQAANLARREISDERRRSWTLNYSIQGHSIEFDGERLLLAPDTIADVVDEENGLESVFWLASVEYVGELESTTTKIQLMRTQDLFFGAEVPSTNAAAKKMKRQPNPDTRVIVNGIATLNSRFRTAPGLDPGGAFVLPNDPFFETSLQGVGEENRNAGAVNNSEAALEERRKLAREATQAQGGIGAAFTGLIEGF
jgi:prophage tail gpP-like protein